jgi:hypothetical protein
MRLALPLVAIAALTGCGAAEKPAPLARTAPSLGPTKQHRPQSLGKRAARGVPISGLRCMRGERSRYGVHLELFAARRVVLVPPGIGIAPPRESSGAYVTSGRCSYPVRTKEPTGVVEVARGGRVETLGDLFDVWGQPLSHERMGGFSGKVSAFVGGRRWLRGPRSIPLRRHAQVVLEVGGYVAPHPSYQFPRGL